MRCSARRCCANGSGSRHVAWRRRATRSSSFAHRLRARTGASRSLLRAAHDDPLLELRGATMKVLVTGGTGFTGTALVRRLLSEGHSVVVLDYKEGLSANELKRRGADVILGSVTSRDIVARAMQGVEVVHHLAAAFRELNVPEKHYYEVNVEGTRNVLTAAARAGVQKVVYCSTCGVHGNIDKAPADETAPIKPADYYQQTKYEAEPFVREIGRAHV